MSLNPNITAANYFLITWQTYNNAPVRQAILDNYGPVYYPAESEEGEPVLVTPDNATMRQALEAANTRHVDSAVPLVHLDGIAPTEVTPDESPDFALIGMRQVPGGVHKVAVQIAEAEGRPYEQVCLSQAQASHYRNTGELPA